MKLFSSFCTFAVSGLVNGEKLSPVFGEEAVWSGDFDNFDFDSFLAKSSSPLAAELLSLREASVEPDIPLDDEGQIQLGQRGWFDDAYTREERRKKKLKQILKMVFFLQADHSAEALEKYLFYGCYCFPDGHQKLFSGYGEPIDEIDRVCKAFQTCYRCVGIDFGQEECINSKGYEFKGITDEDKGTKVIKCMNNGKGEGQRCSRAQCECDRELSLQLSEMEIAWSPMFQSGKYGLFDRPSTCAVQERAAVENEVIEPRCCGYYPKRTPYAYNGPNGIRNCCGSKTYDPNHLECCPGDELQTLGTCIY